MTDVARQTVRATVHPDSPRTVARITGTLTHHPDGYKRWRVTLLADGYRVGVDGAPGQKFLACVKYLLETYALASAALEKAEAQPENAR